MTISAANTETGNAVDWQNPYLGLKAFTEADSIFFFGRSAEQLELFRMVKRSVLTTCFGASGLGKTSLLGAGLFPQLRAALFFPILVRLDFSPGGADLALQVKQRIAEEVRDRGIDAPPAHETETLWEFFHRARFWDRSTRLLMPVLVLDQFEEVFTLGAGDERVRRFWEEMANLIENRIPSSEVDRFANSDETSDFSLDQQHYRVVLSLREDYLPHLEDLQAVIPSLGHNRFRLTAMDGVRALEAILRPGKEIVTEDVALEILRVTCGRGVTNRIPDLSQALTELRVEPTLLGLFCHELNTRRTNAGLKHISMDLLKGSGDQIVSDFYERCLGDRKPAVRAFVEDRLLTGSGFRRAEALEEVIRLPGVTSGDIDELVNRRLLRTERRLGIPHVELTHDVLTAVVAESRNRRLHRTARRRLWLRTGAAAAVVCLGIAVALVWALVRAKEASDSAKEATEKAQREESQKIAYRELLDRYNTLTAGLDKQASPDLQKLREQAAQATQQDICDKYGLCGYTRARWRQEFLRAADTGTWHVLVVSLTSGNLQSAEAARKALQERFPNQDFEVLQTADAGGGNSQYAVVIAQGLTDSRVADRITGFTREAGIEKGAFKRQRR
jgi:hypothetical protein